MTEHFRKEVTITLGTKRVVIQYPKLELEQLSEITK